jgi:hypothetical protein
LPARFVGHNIRGGHPNTFLEFKGANPNTLGSVDWKSETFNYTAALAALSRQIARLKPVRNLVLKLGRKLAGRTGDQDSVRKN